MALNLDSGRDLYIANNEVVNASRSFIIVGRGVNAIVIKNNLRYNTSDFNRYAVRNFSSDTGILLYSYGNAKLNILNNIVHDLPSNLHYTTIMVDNGTGNVTIKGNLFYNIGNEAIYCWKSGSTPKSNSGNALESNIILSTVNYGGYNKKAADNAFYKDNIFIKSPRYKVLQNSDATDKGGNIWIESYRINNEKVFLPKEPYQKVMNDRNMDAWVKKYVGELK